ncbi:MAG: mechanosensitive ion channel family protein [Saprospiraceae bacterium]|nr:mechanosensitive ion channel family protein [Saprospiraceae bacterium]
MTTFMETYRSQIIYGVSVITVVVALYLSTNILHKWILKKAQKKFSDAKPGAINLLKRVLNLLWLVLGIIALSLIFVEEDAYAALQNQFKLLLYLGFLTVLTIVSATSINLWFRRSIQNKIQCHDDPTAFKFLRYAVVYSIYFIGVLFGLMAFPALRSVAQTALGGAGVLALIAGISSQEALSNLVGGLFIIAFKPFKIGNVIEINSAMVGRVKDITLRHTVIRNFENKMIVIPNAIINKEKLVNYDLDELKCCEFIEIGISYDSDVDLAKNIMQQECEKHPLIYDNRTTLDKDNGKPMVRTALTKLSDSSLIIRAWAWARTYGDAFDLKCDVIESIKKGFDKAGIEIPYPYRTVVMKNDSVC